MKPYLLLLTMVLFSVNFSFAEPALLELRGQGQVKYMGFIKVYDASLFTPQPEDTLDILAADVSKCLKLDYAVALSSEVFINSADTILRKQHLAERLSHIEPQLDTINNAYRAVKKGDHYRLCYNATDNTTTLSFNGEQLVTVTSSEFAEIYFGIWLGPDRPIDARLRDDLLNIQK